MRRRIRPTRAALTRPWLGVFICLVACIACASLAHAQAPCAAPLGRIVSVQGHIEIKRAGTAQWSKVERLNVAVCAGDIVHAGKHSRAGLLLAPESLLRLDQFSTVLIRVTGREVEIEMFLEERVPRDAVGESCGAANIITRIPGKFRVKTPYVNAAVEGTEFQVALARTRATLSVFEGRVSAASATAPGDTLRLTAGQATSASEGSSLAPITLIVNAADAVQWALFYPSLGGNGIDEAQCDAAPARADCDTLRAESLLRAGRVDEALALLRGSGDANAPSSDAQALLSLIATVKGDKETALRLAQAAAAAEDRSTRAWLSLSYAQQARFDLDAALRAAQQAATLAPRDVTTQIRVAELLQTLGRGSDAARAAEAIVANHPKVSRAHMVLGYGYLAELKISPAKAAFERAIELDSTDPLSRLGLGLALIRLGDLAGGREQIEIAVALDPANSLLRSYVGKAYFEENTEERDRVAATQFELAKVQDPKDPTPHFYDAIRKQSHNQSAAALGELQSAMDKNNHRAIYRSKLLLDEDQASRGVGLAQVYRELGFDQLALAEANRSVGQDPGNAAAHRFLADAFATLPHHEGAQASEILQAQLRAPLTADPIPPYRGTANLSIPRGSGPVTVSQYELNPLFVRQGVAFAADALVGSNDTRSGQATLNVLGEQHALTAGIFRYSTDGFRQNNDSDRTISSVLVQSKPLSSLALQAELRTSDYRFGDLALRFDPTLLFPDLRHDEQETSLRLGALITPSPSWNILMSGVQDSVDNRLRDVSPIDGEVIVHDVIDQSSLELQSTLQWNDWQLIAGGGALTGSLVETIDIFGISIANPEEGRRQRNAYLYANYHPGGLLQSLQLGLSGDYFEEPALRRSGLNPKAGIILAPWRDATLRMGYMRSLRRILAASQSIEPTQFAGFSQVFNDHDGTNATHWGAGLDQKLGAQLFAGTEWSARRLQVPIVDVAAGTSHDVTWQERRLRAYLYWIANERLALAAEAFYERYTRPQKNPGEETLGDLKSLRAPLSASIQFNQSLSARLTWTYWHQRGIFADPNFEPVAPGNQRFSVTDFYLAYKLPKRRGTLQIGVNNLFNAKHHYQESDRFSPSYIPDRVGYVRVQLSF